MGQNIGEQGYGHHNGPSLCKERAEFDPWNNLTPEFLQIPFNALLLESELQIPSLPSCLGNNDGTCHFREISNRGKHASMSAHQI